MPDTAGPLAGLRIIEISAFVAAPLAGMTLAQLGAEVIRIDSLGGNGDRNRWPVTSDGASLYWAALNKGKRSIELDLKSPQGRAIATELICAPGDGSGIVLTNLPAKGWLDYELMRTRRDDLIMLRLNGNHDGTPAVDYTVNCASGFPEATGTGTEPVNHVLPAWDVAAGLYLALGLLSAERTRRVTGLGQEVKLALSDVMLATVGNLGYLGEVQINGVSRPPIGNHLYGGFGRDFATSDDRAVMITAISDRQWRALGQATGLTDRFALVGQALGVDLDTESGRYAGRRGLAAVLETWVSARTLGEVRSAFDGTGVLWGPYQSFEQLVAEDPRCSTSNPLFADVDHPGVGRVLTPKSPLLFAGTPEPAPASAPVPGSDSPAVIAGLRPTTE